MTLDALNDLAALAAQLAASSSAELAVRAVVDRYVECLQDGRTLFFAGNGGSAAQAQHTAAEYVGQGWAAVALTADTAVLTALANDTEYEHVFCRQWDAFAWAGDVLTVYSTSGKSANLVALGGRVHVSFVGADGCLWLSPVTLAVPSRDRARIQELHLVFSHIIFEQVMEALHG